MPATNRIVLRNVYSPILSHFTRVNMFCACRMSIRHIVQLYDLLLIGSSLQLRRILRLRAIGGTPNIRPRTLPADDAAHGAHQAAEYSVCDDFAHDGADRWGTGSEDTDLDLDESPYACCGDANC